MISKRTVIIAVIVVGLLLAASGPLTLLLFGPGTVGWIITIIAGSSASSRPIHTLFGIVAGLLMLVQFAVLSVLMIGFAEYRCAGCGDWPSHIRTTRKCSACQSTPSLTCWIRACVSGLGSVVVFMA